MLMITTALDITRQHMHVHPTPHSVGSASVASCCDGLHGLLEHVPGRIDLADEVADDGAVIKGTQQLSNTGPLQETTNGVHLANNNLQAWMKEAEIGGGNITSPNMDSVSLQSTSYACMTTS